MKKSRKGKKQGETLHFNLKDASATEPTLISIYFKYAPRTRFFYSTRRSVLPANWDWETERAKPKTPDAANINKELDRLEEAIWSKFQELQTAGKNRAIYHNEPLQSIDINQLKDHLDVITGRKQATNSIEAFIEAEIEKRRLSGKHSQGTLELYGNMLHHFRAYAATQKPKPTFESIDVDFYEKFRDYFFALGLTDVYTAKVIEYFRHFMKTALKKKATFNHYVGGISLREDLGLKKKSAEGHIYLSFDEVAKLFYYDFGDATRLSRARDLIVFACLSGLRYSDWDKVDLSKNVNFTVGGYQFLEVPTEKTNEFAYIPLVSFSKAILERNGGKLPADISDQKARDYIKEACRVAGFDERANKKEQRAGVTIVTPKLRYELAGTHTGRRTLVSLLRTVGTPDNLIRLVTAHKEDGMVNHYDKREPREKAEDLQIYLKRLEEKLDAAKLKQAVS